MQVAERSVSAVKFALPSAHQADVVLLPISRPELGEIRIEDIVFTIGRHEPPFASYGNSMVNMLSRRHACIVRKEGAVYLADLESRNGTSVNHVGVGQAPCELRDGDEICFADALSYRVQISSPYRPEGSLTLTLTPESAATGLDPIVITKLPFLVSKTEATFSHYRSTEAHRRELGHMSRRQAYLYQKGDQLYIEDLNSGNGTFIDGQRLERAVPLRDGVMVGFGGQHFVYRVTVSREPGGEAAGADAARPPVLKLAKTAVRTAAESSAPQAGEVAAPAPAESSTPQAVEAAGPAPAEPAASAARAERPAPARAEGPAPASAGRASPASGDRSTPIPLEAPAQAPLADTNPNMHHAVAANPNTPPQRSESGKTQFMAAPTSFLDILCDASESKDASASDSAAAASAATTKEPAVSRRRRGRAMVLLSELASLHASGDPDGARRGWWRIVAAAVVVCALGVTAYYWNAPERELRNAVDRGEYARAAALAGRLLEKHPDDVELKAWATDATLKANVPVWLSDIKAGDFDAAERVLLGMTDLGMRDAHLRSLIDELERLGNLERVVGSRGGAEAPIRIYADEDSIEQLIGGWNDDTGEHQRALARIASHVPKFGDWYGEALTNLRRLQSESTVYLPVIARLKASIDTELQRDNADALQPILKEAADKYPGLGGLDAVRQDLAGYVEIRREARSRKSGRLFALLHKAHFVTPPVQQAYRTLTGSGQLPPTELIQQYDAATQAWKDGNPAEALAGLQKLAKGSWAEDVEKELERRGRVAARFTELQNSPNGNDYVDQVLTFRESLDADEDIYFVRATAADLSQQKDKVIARAQDAMSRARASWEQYRSNGAIDASQRIETSISEPFRSAARLLADASRSAQQSVLIYAQVDPAGAAQWTGIRDEIETEVRQQRDKLNDLSNVVEPELLRAKLALLGESDND